jgi:hypothetical protein
MPTLAAIGSLVLFVLYPVPGVAGIVWSIVAIDRRKIELRKLFLFVAYWIVLIGFYAWLAPLLDHSLQAIGCPYSAFD